MAIAAELQALYALFQLHCGSYVKGAYNLRKTWKLYERLEKFCSFISNYDVSEMSVL